MYDVGVTAVMTSAWGQAEPAALAATDPARPADPSRPTDPARPAEPGLSALARAISTLQMVPTSGAVEQLLALQDRLEAKVAALLRAFEAEGSWQQDGSVSFTAWLAAHGRRSRKRAHREALAARRLGQLPITEAAWAEGELSSGHVAALVANVPAELAGLYAGHEAAMAPVLAELSVADAACALQAWRARAEALLSRAEPSERPSELYLSRTLYGRRELSGHLSPVDASALEEALAAAGAMAGSGPGAGPGSGLGEGASGSAPGAGGPTLSAPQRRAEALAEVCRWFLAHLGEEGHSIRNRPQVSVIVGLSDLVGDGPGQLADGTTLRAGTVSWLSCDSVLHRVLMAGRSTVLDYGRGTRTVSNSLWAALVTRDGHCRHPGCDRGPSWCEAHHVVHFAKGGPTKLANLVLACTRHHHLWHDQGWDLHLANDASLTLRSPGGLAVSSRPPPRLDL